MLKIKDIKYGIIPTGPAIGVTALQIYFDEIEGEYELDEYDLGKKWEQDRVTKMTSESPRELFLSFLEMIKDKNLQGSYETVINSQQSCFLVFMGGQIDNPTNFKEFNRFHLDLSNRTWNYQVTIGVKVDKMKPPYSIFVGTPNYMSGKNQFYEMFHNIYPVIQLNENGYTKYNALALQECFNGPFTLATIFFDNGKIEELSKFKEQFKIPNHKFCIINTSIADIKDFVLQYNCRCYPYLKGSGVLKFI